MGEEPRDKFQDPSRHLTLGDLAKKRDFTALTLSPAASVVEAAGTFRESAEGVKHSLAVVIDDRRHVVGVLSLGDIAAALYKHKKTIVDLRVSDIMSANVCVADKSDELVKILQKMAEHKIRHMPIVENDVLVGLVTRKDIIEGLYEESAFQLKQISMYLYHSGARY